MPESTLKTVLVLDTETQWYKPVAHNLSPSQAVEVSTEHSVDGKTVKTIDQEKHHRAAGASRCKPCKEAALKATDDSAAQVETPAQG